MQEYIETIKKLLGKEKFSQLSSDIFEEVNKRYRNINIEDATQIVEFNLANVLIIGIERARGCKKEDIGKIINWYNLGSRSFLLQKQVNKFEENYSEYIELIIKNVKENDKTGKSNKEYKIKS